ncbi:NAD(P)/FAD-dependent oxidoreductase [Arboricoccus pini]|nr:FAD-binding oxidoreductase [Arboricoccus pini]
MAAKPLPKSLYAETARAALPTPPLPGDRSTDVAIVGGGFTGLSTALHLAQQGVDVTLIEASEPGWGASGRNGGQVNPGLKHDPSAVIKDHGEALGRRMIELSGGAPARVFDIVRRHQIQCEVAETGTLRAAFNRPGAAMIESTARDYALHGAPVSYLDRQEIKVWTGSDRYACGLIDRRGGKLNPLGYARGLAEAAHNAGAKIHGGTSAVSLAREADGWKLATNSGTLRARRVVLATNGYSDALWPGLARSIIPVFSAIAATEPLSEAQAQGILPEGSVLFEIADLTVYYRLDAHRRLLMGGRSVSRDTGDPIDYRRLTDYAIRLWPTLKDVRWTHFWNGQLAITQDHYPHLHEPAPGLIAALGYNGRGVAMATATGAEVARRLTGTGLDELCLPVSPITTYPFHRFWPLGVTIRLWWGAMRDRLAPAA